MGTIRTVAVKEFKALYKDKRSIFLTFGIPLLLIPVLLTAINLVGKLSPQDNKKMTVGIVGNIPNSLIRNISKIEKTKISNVSTKEDLALQMKSGSIQIGLFADPSFSSKINKDSSGQIMLSFKSTDKKNKELILKAISDYETTLINERLSRINISPDFIDPIIITEIDIVGNKEKMGNIIGSILPYLFIIFSYIGCMGTAIELFTGEKERGTIETLLIAPVNVKDILMGKLTIVTLAGFISSVLSITGLIIYVTINKQLPSDYISSISTLINIKSIVMIVLLIIPLSTLLGGTMIPIAIYSKTFKEAQNIISQLMIIVMVGGMLAMSPIKLTVLTSLIPILNIALCTKAILADTISYSNYFLVIISNIVLSYVAIFYSMKQFGKEDNFLKS